jgi:hypothetical protein
MWWALLSSHSFRLVDYAAFMVLLGLVLGIIIGNAFPDFNNNIKTANYMLLPASVLEKFLSQFFIRVVLTTALFAVIFWIDAWLVRHSISRAARIEEFSYSEMFRQTEKTRDLVAAFFAIFSLMSFLFAARLFFRKYAAVKTLFTGVLLVAGFILAFFLYALIYWNFSPDEISWYKAIEPGGYEVCEGLYNVQLYFYGIGYISWIFFLSAGYFRLKEKQV